MNKSQLVDALAAQFGGNRKSAKHALESVLDTITREVAKGEKVAITGFGSFEKRVRAAGYARNPATGDRIRTVEKAVPKFTPGQDLKNIIAGVKSLPQLTLDTAVAAATGAKNAVAKQAAPAKKAPEKKAPEKKAPAKKTPAKKAPAKTAAKKTAAKKSSAAKAPSKQTAAAKAPAKKEPAKKSAAKKTPAKKTPAKKSAAKKASAKKAPAKKAAKKS